MSALTAEAKAAGDGLVALVRGRPNWDGRFRFTVEGFVRSFAAPLLALPLALLDVALYGRATAGAVSLAALFSGGAAHLVDALGFPMLLALLAAPLGFKAGYAAFVTVNNWATLYLNLALSAASSLLLFGPDGAAAFGLVAVALLCLSVALVWRIGRETLTHDLAPLVLLVVLSVAWSTLADQLSRRLFNA